MYNYLMLVIELGEDGSLYCPKVIYGTDDKLILIDEYKRLSSSLDTSSVDLFRYNFELDQYLPIDLEYL